MNPKRFEKIKSMETKLKDAIFLKDKKKVADWMNALHRCGYSSENAIMETARNFLQQNQAGRR